MEPLRVDKVPAPSLRSYMVRMGGEFRQDKSNTVRHVYFSRRLNRWFAVTSIPGGLIQISHYAQCPCALRA